MLRLNKQLALYLGISRREADALIADGRVKVGDVIAILGQRMELEDSVYLDDTLVEPKSDLIYIALNKPVGYVSSRSQQSEAPTLYELLPEKYRPLKTVGRLDKDSSGLILLTNDGDFAYQMTHPKFTKVKEYLVTLDMELAPLHQQMIADFGVELPDGASKLILTRLEDNNESRRAWRVTMSEGRNRQIRRTFGALGYSVVTLHRIRFGGYQLGGLESGKFEVVQKV